MTGADSYGSAVTLDCTIGFAVQDVVASSTRAASSTPPIDTLLSADHVNAGDRVQDTATISFVGQMSVNQGEEI